MPHGAVPARRSHRGASNPARAAHDTPRSVVPSKNLERILHGADPMLVSPVKGKHSHPTPTERNPMKVKTTLALTGSVLGAGAAFAWYLGVYANASSAFIVAGLWTFLCIWILKIRRQAKSS
jgi:hypothetical protein